MRFMANSLMRLLGCDLSNFETVRVRSLKFYMKIKFALLLHTTMEVMHQATSTYI